MPVSDFPLLLPCRQTALRGFVLAALLTLAGVPPHGATGWARIPGTPRALGAQEVAQDLPVVPLRNGMVITSSMRAAPGVYRFEQQPGDSAVITIRGSGIVVDFRGAELQGTDPSLDPDAARGTGIRIEGGSDVRVLNARVRGYHVGLIARGTRNLQLVDGDFSHNWKARLFSVIEHESLVDWMSHHRNDADEWLRFGAAVYLSDVKGGEVRGNRIEQGMEGLMMVRTDSMLVWNNHIAYNSGVGIGMYRSTHNRIMHNYVSFNVRGFSRYYRRGQDSADLLMYEQTSHNIVAFNTMTHGGDGLFLWAGQSTMDTGQGGSNDNLFYANNFSYAPTNAIETTFSRNTFVNNEAHGSEYGVWGGYSFSSKFIGNRIHDNRTGIAIEHGQDNEIRGNEMGGDSTAVNLWANAIEPSDWGYPKFRDTRSRDHVISDNVISGARVALRVAGSTDVRFTGNQLFSVDSMIVIRDTSKVVSQRNDTSLMHTAVTPHELMTMRRGVQRATLPGMPAELPGGNRNGTLLDDPMVALGRSAIIVDEWGPYSWKYPRLWPVDSTRANPIALRVLGPAGTWRVVDRRGVADVAPESGETLIMPTIGMQTMQDTIVVTPSPGQERDWEITLEYVGVETVSPRGMRRAADVPYRFSYGRYEPSATWDVRFHAWPGDADPRTQPERFAAVLRSRPLLTRREPRLDYMWYSPSIRGLPQAQWAAVATTSVTVPAGEHTLRSISDDGIRVYVDGVRVIDSWTKHESQVDNVAITPGRHDIRVEYFQVDGWSELKVEIVRGTVRSQGSAGPH